jgi:hypothetical protein
MRAKWETLVRLLDLPRQVRAEYELEESKIRGLPGGLPS